MRNFIKNSSLALAAVVALSACGSKANTPEATALAFSQAIGSMDFAKAKSLGDESTGQLLDMIAGMASAATAEDKAKAAAEAKNLKSAKCNVTGETATCTVCCSADGKDGEPVQLAKKGDKWVVAMKKETPAPMESAPVTETEETPVEGTEATEGGEVETNNAE